MHLEVTLHANLASQPRRHRQISRQVEHVILLEGRLRKLAELLGIDVSEIKVLVETVDTKPPKPASLASWILLPTNW